MTAVSSPAVAAAVAAADPATFLPPRRAGEDERLVRPLTLLAALELSQDRDGAAIVASLVADRAGNLLAAPLVLERRAVRRATASDGAGAALVRLVREPAAAIPAFEVVTVAPLPQESRTGGGGQEYPVAADQTHESVVVTGAGGGGDPAGSGHSFVVKWAVHVEVAPGEPAAVSAARHLHAAGFTEMPEPYGFLVARNGDGSVLLASLARYLPGARDGWSWCVEDLTALVENRSTLAAAVQPAEQLGELVARMHVSFARSGPASGPATGPVWTAGTEQLALWSARAEATLDEALALTCGPAGARLRRRQAQARSVLATLADLTPARTAMTRIHGDLHVGQVLRWDGGYAVSDFDGNPVLPAAERGLPAPPARDVAGMLRALDHVGRIVAQRADAGAAGAVDAWIDASGQAFLLAYEAELATHGGSALFDPRLVLAFEVEQECREFVYAARHLPQWTYVPDNALGALLDRVEPDRGSFDAAPLDR